MHTTQSLIPDPLHPHFRIAWAVLLCAVLSAQCRFRTARTFWALPTRTRVPTPRAARTTRRAGSSTTSTWSSTARPTRPSRKLWRGWPRSRLLASLRGTAQHVVAHCYWRTFLLCLAQPPAVLVAAAPVVAIDVLSILHPSPSLVASPAPLRSRVPPCQVRRVSEVV